MANDLERTSFIGTSIPMEIKACIKHMNKLEGKDIVVALLKVVKSHLMNDDTVEEQFESCHEKYGESVHEIFPGLLKIVQEALRHPLYSLNAKDFIKDLTNLGVNKKFHEVLQDAVFGSDRDALDEACLKNKPRYPGLDSFRWRVDVSISTASLNRVLEPSILMEMKTTNGKTECFEVSKQKFHEMRYTIAYVLKQMQQLEKRSVMQIKT